MRALHAESIALLLVRACCSYLRESSIREIRWSQDEPHTWSLRSCARACIQEIAELNLRWTNHVKSLYDTVDVMRMNVDAHTRWRHVPESKPPFSRGFATSLVKEYVRGSAGNLVH